MAAASLSGFCESKEATYAEKYRPQYHFTPAHRWIGDPCGLVRNGGRYLAYSWGAAVSDDLVHWTELNDHAIKELPPKTSAFTGSVVVDRDNTAGYGPGAMIAAFTSFDEDSKKQSQSIAFSHDGGETYRYYDGNPVIDIWSTEFRDPTVIWDEGSRRWVMLVAKALEKKVAFYGSDDLKHWEWLSDFGPLGDSARSWECPDMFQIEVDGKPGVRKWVMVVSVNWAREQYFVGEFDGKRFVADNPGDYPLYVDNGLDYYASRVFQDYDRKDAPVYTIGWVNTWDYANFAPTQYGKGIWSIPREYRLSDTGDGYRLRQIPYKGLESLRGKPYTTSRRLPRGKTDLPQIGDMGNTYEVDVTFTKLGEAPVGLNFCEGDGRRVVLGYDPQSHYLTLDRTNCADTEIAGFERMTYCKVRPIDGKLRLHCFVDKSTIEIFVNDGECTLTALTFPSETQTGFSLTSLDGKTTAEIKAYPLSSIWPPSSPLSSIWPAANIWNDDNPQTPNANN